MIQSATQIPSSGNSKTHARRNYRRLAAVIVCLLLAGCGLQTYETRLSETAVYYGYREKVKLALVRQEDTFKGSGIEYRAPKDFVLLQPPKLKVDQNKIPIPFPPNLDPRQPKFVNGFFPGLVAAYQAKLDVVIEDKVVTRSAYLYVLSNYQLWLDKEQSGKVEPLDFHLDFKGIVARTTDGPLSAGDWIDRKIPPPRKPGPYKPVRLFTTIERSQKIEGIPYTWHIFQYGLKENIQVVVAVIMPTDVDRPEPIRKGVDYSLEWMIVDENIPRRRTRKGTQGSGF